MKLLLINQPTNNRGDEAAHKGFVRSLLALNNKLEITVLFIGEDHSSVKQMQVKDKQIKYIELPLHRGIQRLLKIVFLFKCHRFISYLHPQIKRVRKIIEDHEYIINAPGGICMGTFQNWKHILWIYLAINQNKPTAYYSRSFGPFKTESISDRIFYKKSKFLLESFGFLSIRDQKTMNIAHDLKVNFIKSIDSAFLETPRPKLPKELNTILSSKKYIVFVPNQLKWHPDYKTRNSSDIDRFYIRIINKLIIKYPDYKIIMLPQLFNVADNDFAYFSYLKTNFDTDQLQIISDIYSSDIQQIIISKAQFIIGARYHSIVFGINNSVPVVSLSYEHKMIGLLESLNLLNYNIDISKIGTVEFEDNVKIKDLDNILIKINDHDLFIQASFKARNIALECLYKFEENVSKFIK